MSVPAVETVVAAMDARWRAFGNVSSPKLRELWAEIVRVFNAQIETPTDRWPVVPAELGAGKTTLAKTWCALLPHDGHPGVLVVARTKEQAAEYASDVNRWAAGYGAPAEGRGAFAYHSGREGDDVERKTERKTLRALPLHELAAYPVLAICHKAYELGLDKLGVGEEAPKFSAFMAFNDGTPHGRTRRLVIVDEALDQVYEARVRYRALRDVEKCVPFAIRQAHHAAFTILDSAADALLQASDDRNRVLSAVDLLKRTDDASAPDAAVARLAALWADVRASNRVNPEQRAGIHDTLNALRRHLVAYRWAAGEKAKSSVAGYRLLVTPPGTPGVVLDATARLNNVYGNRPDEFVVCDLPRVRDYGAVTLRHARTRGTGKEAIARGGVALADAVLSTVVDALGAGAHTRKLLVVTTKENEAHFRASGLVDQFGGFDAAHWNALDGRNEWREFDTLLVASLPYGPRSIDLNTYMAVRDVELGDADLNQPPDDVRVIRETRIAAQVAQAIGRIRLRTMTDADGGSAPCDVFLRLPHWNYRVTVDRLLDRIASVLPGAKAVEWTSAGTPLPRPARAAAARDAVRDAFVEYVKAMPAGTWRTVADVRRAIGATAHGTWFRVQNEAAPLLAPLGARIEPQLGRRAPRLVKSA